MQLINWEYVFRRVNEKFRDNYLAPLPTIAEEIIRDIIDEHIEVRKYYADFNQ